MLLSIYNPSSSALLTSRDVFFSLLVLPSSASSDSLVAGMYGSLIHVSKFVFSYPKCCLSYQYLPPLPLWDTLIHFRASWCEIMFFQALVVVCCCRMTKYYNHQILYIYNRAGNQLPCLLMLFLYWCLLALPLSLCILADHYNASGITILLGCLMIS